VLLIDPLLEKAEWKLACQPSNAIALGSSSKIGDTGQLSHRVPDDD
jgi:hypothetical protein